MIYLAKYIDKNSKLGAIVLIRDKKKLKFDLDKDYYNGLIVWSIYNSIGEWQIPTLVAIDYKSFSDIEKMPLSLLLLFTAKCKDEEYRNILKKELKKML